MSRIKQIAAFAVASAMFLSAAGYMTAGTAKATNASCAEQATTLTTGNLSRLASNGKYQLKGDTTGDLYLRLNDYLQSSSVEVDLNGCTLNGTITVGNGSTVTIIDSSAEGTGTVTGGRNRNAAVSETAWAILGGDGNLVIKGGNFMKTVRSDGNVTISGGTFVAGDERFVAGHVEQGYGAFPMEDGRIIVEPILAEENVTFPESIELTEGESTQIEVTTDPESKVLSVAYDPTENEYFEIDDEGNLKALLAGETEVKVTVSQGNQEVASKTIPVKINPLLKWVKINDWQDNENEPADGFCMGYHSMMPGETFAIITETNVEGLDAEINIEVVPDYSYDGTGAVIDPTVRVATLSDDQKTLTAENTGYVRLNVTATYNGTTVTSHGHLYVGWLRHEVVEGDGAEYDGNDLQQKVDADAEKLREIYVCPKSGYEDFYAKYGEDSQAWDDEAWAAFDELSAMCETPIDAANYTTAEDGTVTFLSSWLATLASGTYDVYYSYTDGYAEATLVIPEPKNEVEIVSLASVAVGNTGLMTAPTSEGARSTMSGTVVAAVAAIVAAIVALIAKRKAARK